MLARDSVAALATLLAVRVFAGCGAPAPVVAAPLAAPVESATDAGGGESAPDAANNSSDAADLAPGLAALLRTGLRVELLVEVEVARPGSGTVRVSAGSCSVTFDPWNEIYRIRVPVGASPGSSRDTVVMTLVGVALDAESEEWVGFSPLVYSSEQAARMREGGRRLFRDIDREGLAV